MTEDKFNELEKQILSRKDMMRVFGVSGVTIWKWVRDGFIREYKFDRSVYYIKDEVIEDLRKHGSRFRKS